MVRRRRRIKRRARPPGQCYFCQQKKEPDYKNPETLKRFISDRGKIFPKSRTGLCAKHQRSLAKQVKRSRFIALLPFMVKAD